MSPQEMYDWALDRARDALSGAERKVEKLRGHLDGAESWLDEAQATVDALDAKGLDGFLADLGDDAPAPAPEPSATGQAGAAALNASAKTVDGA